MSCHHNARTRLPHNPSSLLKHLSRLFFFFHFLRGSSTLWEIERAFAERFLACLRVGSTTQLEQACAAIDHRQLVARTKTLRFGEKAWLCRCVDKQFPFDAFVARQEERNSLVMGVATRFFVRLSNVNSSKQGTTQLLKYRDKQSRSRQRYWQRAPPRMPRQQASSP